MIDDADWEAICPACSGSGEGRYEGSSCYKCGGSGVDRETKEYDCDDTED